MLRIPAVLALLGVLCCAGPALAEDLPVASGDKLNVAVTGETDLTHSYTVDQDGNIVVPLIGKVPVKGLLPPQVREELIKRLARYVKDPQVSVEFMERATIVVGFTGAVGKAGAVTVKKGARLTDALAVAEGLAADADPTRVTLQRRGEGSARSLDLHKLLLGDGSLNLELKDGDAVFVPRMQTNLVRVLGAVNKPGDVTKKETVPVLEAVLAAGGLTPDADRRHAQLLRKGAAAPELVNLDDVLSGAKADTILKDGDVLTVPAIAKVTIKVYGQVAKPGDSELKTGTTVLEALTAAGGFGMDADRAAVFLSMPNGDVRKLNLEKLDSADGNFPLPDGAKLFVPQQALITYAVAGGVHQPGRFPMPAEGKGKIYLTDALAQAGGMVERAKKKAIAVVHKDPAGGPPKVEQIDFEALLKKKDPKANVEIHPNDVVIVDVEPEGSRKRNPLEYILGIAGAFIGF